MAQQRLRKRGKSSVPTLRQYKMVHVYDCTSYEYIFFSKKKPPFDAFCDIKNFHVKVLYVFGNRVFAL